MTAMPARRFMESEFKILCNEHQACPAVKRVLADLGFTNLKDLHNSPTFDISARIHVEDGKEAEKIAHEIFKECQNRVQTIQVNIRN